VDEVVGDTSSTTALIAVIFHACVLDTSRSTKQNTIATDHCSTGYLSPSSGIYLDPTLYIGTHLPFQSPPSLASSASHLSTGQDLDLRYLYSNHICRQKRSSTLLLAHLAYDLGRSFDFSLFLPNCDCFATPLARYPYGHSTQSARSRRQPLARH
jgi:hypothetical protein